MGKKSLRASTASTSSAPPSSGGDGAANKGTLKSQKKTKKHEEHPDESHAEIDGDSRFSSVLSAPIFKSIPSQKTKVVLDDRFKSILTDEKFRVLPSDSVDPYGRKLKKSKKHGESSKDAALKELESFYTIEPDSVQDKAQEELEEQEADVQKTQKHKESSKKNKATKPMNEEERLDYLNKLARGEISGDSSSSSSDEDSSDGMELSEESEEEEEEDDEGEEEEYYDENGKSLLDIPGDDNVEYGDATRRISILNCDWENIKSEDLM